MNRFCALALSTAVVAIGLSSCQQSEPVAVDSSAGTVAAVYTFKHGEATYKVPCVMKDGQLSPIESADAQAVHELLNVATVGILTDPNDTLTTFIYVNDAERDAAVAALRNKCEGSPGLSKRASSFEQYAEVYADLNCTGYSFTVDYNGYYSYNDFANYQIDNTTTSVSFSGYPGDAVTFYEHPNWGGKSFTMVIPRCICDLNGRNCVACDEWKTQKKNDLRAYCKGFSIFGWCWSSWNDCISSAKLN